MAKHLTEIERKTIHVLKQEGYSNREIGAVLNYHHGTISREIKRNSDSTGTYKFEIAEKKANERKKLKEKRKTFTLEMKACVDALLDLDYSPEQMVGYCKSLNIEIVCISSIYKYINKSNKKTKLRYYKKGRRKKQRNDTSDKLNIKDRPEIVDTRSRFGDLEVDTIVGKGHKSGILTIVDRKTRFLWAAKVDTFQSFEIACKFIGLLLAIKEKIKTITSDNGSEFSDYKIISNDLNAQFYFCDPSSPHQRGTNENTNGLIRQYFKKGSDLSKVTDSDVEKVVDKINSRPRKILGFRAPCEVFLKEILAV